MTDTTASLVARRSYTLVLEVTPTAPLSHGMGTEGNTQVLLRREILAPAPGGGWETIYVPAVSGAALKATLREWAVRDYLERAGVADGLVSRDALRLLLKGGKNDAGGQSVSLAAARRLRDLCPALAVFGSMDGGLPIRAAIQVSDVLPWCVETLDAGLVSREVRPLAVSLDGTGLLEDRTIPVFPGVDPPSIYETTTTTTYYRHDILSGAMTQYLPGADVRQIEDGRQAVSEAKRTKGGPKPDAATRREANESMPHSAEAIRPGVPMVATIRLQDATEVEFAALGVALLRWIQSGAHLGGGATKGHGACRVRVAGALRHELPAGVQATAPGEPLPVLAVGFDGSEAARAYHAHIHARATSIRQWVAETTR